jgi:hypothetical protein
VLALPLALAALLQAAPCLQDEAVLDGNADGLVSVGDVVVAPPGAVGEVGAEHRLLNRPLAPLGGSLAFLDRDANGAPTAEDVALWDHGSNGRNPGDVLLGSVGGARPLPFGHVLRGGEGLGGGLGPYAAGFGFLDGSGDGRRQPREALYGSQGGAVAAGDVRLAVDGWARGSLVRETDGDVGSALTLGPALGFVDEDGSTDFTAADCPASSSSSSSGGANSTSSSASPSPSSSTGASTGASGSHTETPPATPPPKGTPGPGWALAVILLFAAAARRLR